VLQVDYLQRLRTGLLRVLSGGVNEFMEGYEGTRNLVENKKVIDRLADFHIVLNGHGKIACRLMNACTWG